MTTIRVLSLIMLPIHLELIHPINIPNIGPPKDSLKNFSIEPYRSNEECKTTSLLTRNKTKAVPSLRSCSPSRRVENFIEEPTSLSKATTATGSVVLTIELLIC
jgi:hypothetical protein